MALTSFRAYAADDPDGFPVTGPPVIEAGAPTSMPEAPAPTPRAEANARTHAAVAVGARLGAFPVSMGVGPATFSGPAPAPIQPDRRVDGALTVSSWRPLAIAGDEPPPPSRGYSYPSPPPPPPPVRPAPPPPPPAAAAPPAPEVHVVKSKWRFDQHTLVGLRKASGRFGPYIALTGVNSRYEGERTGTFGFEGGFVLASHFALGAAVYGTDCFDANDHVVNFVYGGVQPGVILWTRAVIHPRLDILLGGGTVYDTDTWHVIGHAAVSVPRLGAELNITRAIRLSGDVSWRTVAAPADVRAGFSSVQAGLTLRIGWM